MAATVTANLTLLDDNDNSGNWGGTDGADAYNTHIQGTNSESWQVSKNSSETAAWNDGASHDMSTTNTHLYLWFKSDLTNYYTTVKVQIISTTGNYREYEIANQTTKIWNGAWRCFVLDLTGGTETGTFDSSDVNDIEITVDNSASGNIRSVINNWIDVMRYGTGLTVTGTTFDITDIAAIDQLEANQYGVLENIQDIIFAQGQVIIGNGTTTTTFSSSNEVLVFKNEPYIKSGSYQLKLQGSGNTSVIDAFTLRASGTTITHRFIFDASDTTSDITIDGISVTRAALTTFSSVTDIQNFTFNNCFQVNPGTGTFKYGSILNYVGTAGGALLWPSDDSNISDITFAICDEDVEITAASDSAPAFSNIVHDDNSGDYDVNNTSGASVTVALSGTSNGNSYTGSLVTFSSSSTLILTVKDESGAALGDAYAYIDDDNITPFIMNTTTNATTGIASTAWTGGSVAGATWRVRKYGYKPFKVIADVPASGTKDIPVTMVADPQQT